MNAFLSELLQYRLYKRRQGKITRQVTFAAIAVSIVLGLWQLWDYMHDNKVPYLSFIPVVLLVLGVWAAFRLVNLPEFADFLIAVEAEMKKVMWPDRGTLIRASIVVLVTIFFLAAVLFMFDLFWRVVLVDAVIPWLNRLVG